MIIDYKIAVRSYKRYDLFKSMTYNMLLENNINVKEKLFIFVASEEEKLLYEESLNGLEYNSIIVTELGGEKAIKYAVDYFNKDDFIIFMDDDLEYFFEFTDTPEKSNLVKNSKNLEKYIFDALNTFDESINIFSFLYMINDFYIKDKPFKEFKPFLIAGSCFGARNNDLLVTDHAHLDDIHRSCKYIRDYGGGLIYNWAGFKTNTGLNPGGMQESGDRGIGEIRNEKMKEIAYTIHSIPYVKSITREPKFFDHTKCWEIRLKPITSIKKIYNLNTKKWSKYFQETEDTFTNQTIDSFL